MIAINLLNWIKSTLRRPTTATIIQFSHSKTKYSRRKKKHFASRASENDQSHIGHWLCSKQHNNLTSSQFTFYFLCCAVLCVVCMFSILICLLFIKCFYMWNKYIQWFHFSIRLELKLWVDRRRHRRPFAVFIPVMGSSERWTSTNSLSV